MCDPTQVGREPCFRYWIINLKICVRDFQRSEKWKTTRVESQSSSIVMLWKIFLNLSTSFSSWWKWCDDVPRENTNESEAAFFQHSSALLDNVYLWNSDVFALLSRSRLDGAEINNNNSFSARLVYPLTPTLNSESSHFTQETPNLLPFVTEAPQQGFFLLAFLNVSL